MSSGIERPDLFVTVKKINTDQGLDRVPQTRYEPKSPTSNYVQTQISNYSPFSQPPVANHSFEVPSQALQTHHETSKTTTVVQARIPRTQSASSLSTLYPAQRPNRISPTLDSTTRKTTPFVQKALSGGQSIVRDDAEKENQIGNHRLFRTTSGAVPKKTIKPIKRSILRGDEKETGRGKKQTKSSDQAQHYQDFSPEDLHLLIQTYNKNDSRTLIKGSSRFNSTTSSS
jgi:hypothetical protein